ncbi:MAG: Crp/Fnr family transcriptional regulator [Elusimicrobia bacterium]|nr:Crp/Fnr family transcriptional regulator [Elusimicrobiota bacterium]
MPRRKGLYPEFVTSRNGYDDPAELAAFLREKSPLLKRVPAKAQRAVADAASVRSYAKGQYLCHAGEPAKDIWVLLEGRVCVNRCGFTGSRLCIEVMTPGDIFGLPALAWRNYPSEIQATRDSILAAVPKTAVEALIDRYPELAREILQAICQRLHYMETTLLMSRESLEKRAAAALLYLHHKFGLTLPLTQTEIGEMLGAAPESAMRLLKDFENRGWLRRGARGIVIADIDALQAQLRL